MRIGPTLLLDTFAEGFGMRYARLILTGHDAYWLDAAAREFSGYGSSVIACDAEVGVESSLAPEESPDGRPGLTLLAFGFSSEPLGQALVGRTGQCLMTAATTAVFDGLPDSEKRLPLGRSLRFFGDGFQKSKQVGGRRYWRIPVMDGEFLVVDDLGCERGVAGGNLILQAVDLPTALTAARRGVEAIESLPGVITPFPGGVARSGSKVGSRYPRLKASTADAYCPTLRGRVDSQILPAANAALEIVIDGVDPPHVAAAMRAAILAIAGRGVVAIGAGNYGGKLGKHHFPLHPLMQRG